MYIQCLPSSFATTRSIVLLTPNGLLQRMQQNGSSSFRTRADALAARKSIWGFSVMTFSGQVAWHKPALHAGIFDKAQHRPFGVVAQCAGRTGRHAGQAQRAAANVDLDRAERRSFRQRDDVDGGRSGAVKFAQRKAQHVPLSARSAGSLPDAAPTALAEWLATPLTAESGSSVSMVAIRPAPKPRPSRIGSASAIVRIKPVTSWRGRARSRSRIASRAIGKGGGDALQSDLRDLVDRERQDMRRQPVAEPRQRVDQRRAVGIIVQQHDRRVRRRPRDRRSASLRSLRISASAGGSA